MTRKDGKRYLLALLVALLGILTPACKSQVEREQVEAELALFMRAYIVDQYLDVQLAYLPPTDSPQAVARAIPSIIIWAPPGRNPHSPGEFVKLDQPIQVWLFSDGQLIEQSDKTGAIAQYEQEFIPNPVTESWGFYSFGIFTVSRDNQQAEVYLGIFCGPMCGIGYMYTLQRDSSAAWNITDSEIVWLV